MKTEEIDALIDEALQKNKSSKRHHRRSDDENQRILKQMKRQQWRNLLNMIFILGFVVAIILYFAMPNNRTPFFITGFAAMAFKIAEFIIRFKA